jgi:hypothetical protein
MPCLIGNGNCDTVDELLGLGVVGDAVGEPVDDAVLGFWCLDPSTPPRTAARTHVSPITAHNIMRFFVQSVCFVT